MVKNRREFDVKMHPKNEFKALSFVFACIGMASVQSHFRSNVPIRNLCLMIPTCVQLMVVSLELYAVLVYPTEFYHTSLLVGGYIDVVLIVGLFVVGIIQIVENISKSQIDQRIKESIESVDREIFRIHYCRGSGKCAFCQKLSLKPFLIKRAPYLFVVSLAIDSIVVLMLHENNRIWKHNICIREFTANMIRIGLFYVACHFYWVNNWSR